MKILLIFLEDEAEPANRLISFMRKLKMPVVTLPIKTQDEARRNIEIQFSAFFIPSESEKPTHVIILSTLAPGWIDFIAGFSCGSHVPILVCGEETVKSIPDAFAFCFKLINTEAELYKFLDVEWEFSKKADVDKGAKKARESLLKMGIPVSEESMARCVSEGNIQAIMFFMAAGFSPNTTNKAGVPVMSIAARHGNGELVRVLHFAGAKLDSRADDRGTTALIDSVMGNHFALVKDLVKAGADVNIQSKNGQTALIVAVGAGEENIVETLLEAGSDPDIQDSMGASARKYAALFHKTAIISLFDKYNPSKAV
jgi:hypothetical protein